jgi:hypothetical protein
MRRFLSAIGTGFLLLLPAAHVSAQSADAFLTVDPTEFGQGQTIDLNANFGASMPEYYGPVVGWQAELRISASNGRSQRQR